MQHADACPSTEVGGYYIIILSQRTGDPLNVCWSTLQPRQRASLYMFEKFFEGPTSPNFR
jgi:hypothetical protein